MSAHPFTFPDMPRLHLLALVASLPNSYDTPHNRRSYTLEGFADDFGQIIIPGYMGTSTFASRHYYFKGQP